MPVPPTSPEKTESTSLARYSDPVESICTAVTAPPEISIVALNPAPWDPAAPVVILILAPIPACTEQSYWIVSVGADDLITR